jgi:hypothetical protein
MAGFDLGSIIAQAAQLSGTQTQQAQDVASLQNQSARLSEEAAGNIREAGSLQSQAQLVELQGQLQTQKNRVQAANAFGTNVGDVSDIITQLGMSMREDAIKLTAAQSTVSEIEANSDILANPGGWLRDLVQGDAARAERDALANKFDTTQKLAQGLNAATQATVQTQNAITETLTAASIKQTADSTKLLADAEASKQAIAGKQYGAQAIEALRANGSAEFNRSLQAYNLITEDARYKEGFALRQEQFRALQDQRKKVKLEDQEYADATVRVNTYRTQAGLPPVNETFVRRTLTQPGELGEDTRRQERQGMNLEGGSLKVFGNTAAETMQVIQRDQPNLPDSFAPAVSILQQASQAAAEEITRIGLTDQGLALKKDPVARAELVNQQVVKTAVGLQSNVQSGKGNPYEAPAVSVVLAEPNGLAATKFGKLVLQTLVSTGQDNPSPDMVLAAGISAVDAGELSLSEVRNGIAEFYQNAVGINNATSGFLQLGVPAQQGYRTQVQALAAPRTARPDGAELKDYLTFGATAVFDTALLGPPSEQEKQLRKQRTLDLTKSTDVTLALTVMQSRKLAESIVKRAPK